METIYIIDDDRDFVESLSIVLKSAGYRVHAQYDHDHAVRNVERLKPDLVILDVMFPEDPAAGFEIARTLRRDPRTEAIPIFMLSAVNERGAYAGTFSNRDLDDSWLPVDEFIEKPIQPATLLQKVRIIFAKKGSPHSFGGSLLPDSNLTHRENLLG